MQELLDRQTDNNSGGYNIVSLGFFCGVAMELERVGLRNCSLPFDWIISGDFQSVLALIANHFEGFTETDNLYQEFEICPSYYYNKACNVHFYHDFSRYKDFKQQYDSFRAKYSRRIERFYQTIERPTIFVRYCSNHEELKYISENQEKISSFLKTFNPSNEILYITSLESQLEIENSLHVEKEAGAGVVDLFLDQLPQLRTYLEKNSILRGEIKKNIMRWKRNKNKKIIPRIIAAGRRKLCTKVYYHTQQYKDIEKENYEHGA